MRMTLEQLGRFCAVHDLYAEIDGDHMLARLYDTRTDELVNTAFLK